MIWSTWPAGTCSICRSAQAAPARRQRARNAPLLPGRSESVVRGSPKAHRPRRPGANGRGTRPSCRAEVGPLCAVPQKRTDSLRPGANGRGTRPSCRAEASPLCAVPQKRTDSLRPGANGRGTRPSCRAEASPLCAVPLPQEHTGAPRLPAPGRATNSTACGRKS